MQSSKLDKSFYYPARELGLCWEWPSDVNGGFFSWIYKTWTLKNKESKQIYSGRIILGFKKITITWDCDPAEAYFIHKQGQERLYKYLESIMPDFKKEKCCGGGCGCH